ncbi:hypothetical protein SPRG_21228 [Saprolegnia parasitica CBS 223.65]|uniref:Uncharacterized protein n=1 Tax=Saprolegnia parasitica (strain CBS 223.65) TaxID=695850 RepID=A0A067BNW8_SAPPC|nr:hypothetical protein SPRG_21228 [Saprolegnia parasitica CBS 223.65]KDO19943.1 hypothetical protein SPRG_21228 [Saprolegnia parasitica CBS 223.65]|eukprot:XP_012209348.1 hypothetical protein SPRG_21228 [Saprolegnia parasitica CBS 223.65]
MPTAHCPKRSLCWPLPAIRWSSTAPRSQHRSLCGWSARCSDPLVLPRSSTMPARLHRSWHSSQKLSPQRLSTWSSSSSTRRHASTSRLPRCCRYSDYPRTRIPGTSIDPTILIHGHSAPRRRRPPQPLYLVCWTPTIPWKMTSAATAINY